MHGYDSYNNPQRLYIKVVLQSVLPNLLYPDLLRGDNDRSLYMEHPERTKSFDHVGGDRITLYSDPGKYWAR